MKRLIVILFLIIPFNVFCQSCDSTIHCTIYSYDSDGWPDDTLYYIDTIQTGNGWVKLIHGNTSTTSYYDANSRLIAVVTSNDSTTYSYDSFSRIILTMYFIKTGSVWEYDSDTSQVNNYYSTVGIDSIVKFRWDGSLMNAFCKKQFFYNASDTLFRINVMVFDSSQWSLDTLYHVSYGHWYGPGRLDSVYIDSIPHADPDYIFYYDTLGNIIYSYDANVTYETRYFYECGQSAGYDYWPFSDYAYNIYFDSQCRKVYEKFGWFTGKSYGPYSIRHYIYSGCSSQVIQSSHDVLICVGDTANISAVHFGGTAPHTVQWSPSTGLGSPLSLSTTAYPSATTNYMITITDANGLTVTDSVVVNVNQQGAGNIFISSIDTNSVCQSAVLAVDSLSPTIFHWYLDGAFFRNYSQAPIMHNGTYVCQSINSVCSSTRDTIHINFFHHEPPEIQITKSCNTISAHAGLHDHIEWYFDGQIISGQSADSLVVSQQGAYTARAVDSLGCYSFFSNEVSHYYQGPNVALSNHPPACPTCTDGFTVIMATGNTPPYAYSVDGSAWQLSDTLFNLSSGSHVICAMSTVTYCTTCERQSITTNYESVPVESYLTVYPNPVTDNLHIHLNNFVRDKQDLIICNVLGEKLRAISVKESDINIPRGNLIPGFYLILLRQDGIIKARVKIAVQ